MQPQYRAYASQQVPQRSAHASNQRRGGIGPMMSNGSHPQIPPTQTQLAQQHQVQTQVTELAKRRSQRPSDRNLPDGIEDNIIESDVVQRYHDLREVEQRLDATMTRKRMDINESVNNSTKTFRTMRIWITNTVEDQVWQGNGLNVDAFDFTPNMEASFRVKIEGRLLDDEGHPEAQELHDDAKKNGTDSTTSDSFHKAFPEEHKYRFSHFFKSLDVEFDASRFRHGAGHTVEWRKPEPSARSTLSAAADFDEFTFKRNGDENVNIKINLHRHEPQERYKLSQELADIVDMTEATRREAVVGLWEYIRLSGLQEDEEKRNFRCDELLKKVVGRGDIGHIPLLNEYVTQHLTLLPPVSLDYTIRVDEDFHKDPQPTIYDVQVLVEDPLSAVLQPLIHNPQYVAMLKDLTALDEQLIRIVQAIAVSKSRHSFLTSLSEDPANFVRHWLSSQKHDLDMIMGESPRGSEFLAGDDWRRGGSNSIWATQNTRESVTVLLSKAR